MLRIDPDARSLSAEKHATSSESTAVSPRGEQWLDRAVLLRLESRERGHLDTLRFTPFALPPCGPGQVLIDVKAAGMNFRDVLKALALYPGETPDARIFGDEVGGVVRPLDEASRMSHREIGCLGSLFSVLPPKRWRGAATSAASRRAFLLRKQRRCRWSS